MSGEMIEAEIERLTQDRDNWQKRAKALADALETAAQRMTLDNCHLIDERDAARIDAINWQHAAKVDADALRTAQQWISDANEKNNVMATERDAARAELERMRAECGAAEQQLCMALTEVRAQLAANRVIIEERDAAERERTESRAEAVRLLAECEGLAADLLRITAERDTDRLDLAQVRYERDTALATFKEQQTANAALWEAQQAHQRKADHDQVIIEALREALERTEKRLSQAKSRQIPPALVGLLGVIRREAAAAEKMISQS